jgi:hypothetical protein
MKKIIIITCAIMAFGAGAQAQSAFEKGNIVANVGIGLGSYIGGSGYKTTVLPISVSAEYGLLDITDKITLGVGGYLAYTANKYEETYAILQTSYSYAFKYSYFIIGARGIAHYKLSEKFDPYLGVMLGYNVASSKYDGDNIPNYTPTAASAGGFSYSAFVGARYLFSEKIGVFAELGYGIAVLELGLTVKF